MVPQPWTAYLDRCADERLRDGLIADLLAERESYYREVATFRVHTDERPPQRVVAEILGFIEAD